MASTKAAVLIEQFCKKEKKPGKTKARGRRGDHQWVR
jgi:hypothetical protein